MAAPAKKIIGVTGSYYANDDHLANGDYKFEQQQNEDREININFLLNAIENARNKSNAFLTNEIDKVKNKEANPAKKRRLDK